MHKLPLFLLLPIFCLFILCCHAQNKYALVIGINNYYSAPGVLNKENCLHGCVNDANAMRSFLIHRFGFEEANVVSVLNEKATQRNVIEACFAIMKKCRRGDAFFFYYSGHGVYLENSYLYNDAVKRGFNNALCMTDLYAPNFDCLLRDSTIKRLINRFIDKGIVVTSVFDCCFSETMAAELALSADTHNQYKEYNPPVETNVDISEDKSIEMKTLPLMLNAVAPRGCRLDSAGKIDKSEPDTDEDGVPDCKDWEVATKKECFPVTADGVGKCSFSYYTFRMPEYFDSAENKITDSVANDSPLTTRAFNFETIKIRDTVFVPRPADRKNSGFFSLSASTYDQKAAEVFDESHFPHGAFTKSLLNIYKNNPASLPVNMLFDKLKKEMNTVQLFVQQPTHYMDSANRLHSNLIGIPEQAFNNVISANCVAHSGDTVIINAGVNDGLANGNILTDKTHKIKMVVTHVYADSAVAMATKGNASIKSGDVFILSDGYTLSKPFLKVYIPVSKVASKQYAIMFSQKVIFYTKQTQYSDYKNWDFAKPSTNYFFNGKDITGSDFQSPVKSYQMPANKEVRPFYFFLSVPSDIGAALQQALGKDQNVQLVNSLQEADMILYLNYAKVSKYNTKAGFILTYRPQVKSTVNEYREPVFFVYHTQVFPLLLQKITMESLAKYVLDITRKVERAKSSFYWLNEEEKR